MTSLIRSPLVSVMATVLLLGVLVGAQAPPVSLRILSPTDDAYVSGPVLLQARVDPVEAAVTRMTFYANGQHVCDRYRAPFRCVWNAGPGINEHHVRVVANLPDGQRLVRTVRTRRADFAEAVDVDVVQVTATVTDEAGDFVKGLPREAFRVYEDRVLQGVTHFAAEDVPLEIVVAIDVSSSMAGAMEGVKLAVKRFLGSLRAEDQVTLLAFNDNIFTLARREADAAIRLRAVDRLRPWGGTALYDVIVRAIGLLGGQVGRRAVVIFTDGDDQSSHVPIEAVEAAVESSDATLYLIGQGRATRLAGLKQVLDRLADVSGGRALHTDNLTTLEAAFDQILAELSNQYLLIYPPTNMVRDNTWREITVELLEGDHHLRARRGYRAVPRDAVRSDR